MKTESITAKGPIPIRKNDRSENISRSVEKVKEKEFESKIAREAEAAKKDQEPKGVKIDQLTSVKNYLAESIEWRDMRFYRHEDNGRIYIDIVDRESGKVVRTVPEAEFIKLANQLKHNPGITIDISG